MSVVVLGSSGGGTATLGHTDPVELLTTIHNELGRIEHFSNGYSIQDDADTTAATNPISTSQDKKETEPGMESSAAVKRGKRQRVKHGIKHALFVSLHGGKGMDSVDVDVDMATLYAVGCHENNNNNHTDNENVFHVRVACTGTLRTVNQQVSRLESNIVAPFLRSTNVNDHDTSHPIRGLIAISSDPSHTNHACFSAAAQTGIPVTGSGGTSLSTAASLFDDNGHLSGNGGALHLVGNAGGSVATTTYTRAVSYCCALAQAWQAHEQQQQDDWRGSCTYSPFQPSSNQNQNHNHNNNQAPRMGSILDACLPAFLAVCLSCRFLEWIQSHFSETATTWVTPLLHPLRYQALPTVCCVVAATTYAPQHGSTAIMSASIAAMSCSGSVLSGLLAGYIVSLLLGRVLFTCIRLQVPATMTNILVAGCVGATVALTLAATGIPTLLSLATHGIRQLVHYPAHTSLTALHSLSKWSWDWIWNIQYQDAILYTSTNKPAPPGLGFVFGCLFCYGSKVGWYHTLFLPVILIEMEHGHPSLWGAVDECTLVLVSGGICAANLVIGWLRNLKNGRTNPVTSSSSSSSSSSTLKLCQRGLYTNLLCGDFIEVAYPFMERSTIVNVAGYLASGLSTEVLYGYVYGQDPTHVLSSAYVPVFVSVALARDGWCMMFAGCVAFGISFLGVLVGALVVGDGGGGEREEDLSGNQKED